MRWQGGRLSSNIEDRRSGSGRWFIGGGLGFAGILLVMWLLGANPLRLLGLVALDNSVKEIENYTPTASEDSLAKFVSVVLANTEDVWAAEFKKMGKAYRNPKLVLFHRLATSACGFASQATGPFYCPEDEKVYIDLSFYTEMKERYHAAGDFAFAYVVAHEIGHHVQKQFGVLDSINAIRREVSEKESNALSVRIELQADFYAGFWANRSNNMFNNLDDGDIKEALNAASAIGDDRLQKQSQGYVVPDSFTHGTSEQRQHWFYKGYATSDIRDGDTFAAKEL